MKNVKKSNSFEVTISQPMVILCTRPIFEFFTEVLKSVVSVCIVQTNFIIFVVRLQGYFYRTLRISDPLLFLVLIFRKVKCDFINNNFLEMALSQIIDIQKLILLFRVDFSECSLTNLDFFSPEIDILCSGCQFKEEIQIFYAMQSKNCL